jgi:hypothetical protein
LPRIGVAEPIVQEITNENDYPTARRLSHFFVEMKNGATALRLTSTHFPTQKIGLVVKCFLSHVMPNAVLGDIIEQF